MRLRPGDDESVGSAPTGDSTASGTKPGGDESECTELSEEELEDVFGGLEHPVIQELDVLPRSGTEAAW